MTKTEAADILATRIRVYARQNDAAITKDMVEALIGESQHWGGLYVAAHAAAPAWRTVLRAATRHEL